MPFVSKAQQRFMNSPTGVAKIGRAKVDEFNAATDFKDLPERKPGAISQAIKKPKTMKATGPGAIGARFRGKS